MKEESIVSKPLVLTDYQRKLIKDNFEYVKNGLKSKEKHNRHFCGGNFENSISEASQYIVEAAISYDYNKNKNFYAYAINICEKRYIDEYRKLNRYTRSTLEKKRTTVNDIKRRLLLSKGYFTEEDIEKEIVNFDFKSPTLNNTKVYKRIPSEQMENVVKNSFTLNKDLDILEWNDVKYNILKELDSSFREDYEDENKNLSSRIHKILIREHILPKCDGEHYKILSDISKEVSLTESRLSQILRGEKMKKFINKFYGLPNV